VARAAGRGRPVGHDDVTAERPDRIAHSDIREHDELDRLPHGDFRIVDSLSREHVSYDRERLWLFLVVSRLLREHHSFDRDVRGDAPGTHSLRREQRSFDRVSHGNGPGPHPFERYAHSNERPDVWTRRLALSGRSAALSFDPVPHAVIWMTLPHVRRPLRHSPMHDGLRRAHHLDDRACVSVIRASHRPIREPHPELPVDVSDLRVTLAEIPEHDPEDPVDARTLPVMRPDERERKKEKRQRPSAVPVTGS
jgi:hypothetical protein